VLNMHWPVQAVEFVMARAGEETRGVALKAARAERPLGAEARRAARAAVVEVAVVQRSARAATAHQVTVARATVRLLEATLRRLSLKKERELGRSRIQVG
jgi:hypothetical protein